MPLEYPIINDIVSNSLLFTGSTHLTALTPLIDFTALTTELGFFNDFTKLCADVTTKSSKLDEIEDDFSAYIEMEMRRREKRFPHLTRDQIWEIMDDHGSSRQMDMSNALFDDLENTPIDYSNKFEHNGHIIDVSKLSYTEVMKLSTEVDDITKFESLEHVRSLYLSTCPTVKLFYAEPFIASPSFIHSDLGFLHILQYQFWLWFVFIFLIVFFFVSFLCVVRWCTTRNQTRRETRGVSRSKCGDLITATVPVTWAISIIVSETTDATDVYDGFGTEEIIVGVRAYQWGWEYYYPKNVDLNYNLKPSYSTFVGNSLKYNSVYERKLDSNNVWKFYQQKSEDAVITPAHLLVLPLDNSKIFNFMNFDNIGANALKNSNAFRKIRDHSKVYKTNLVATPSVFADKYVRLNSLYFTENDLNNSFNYGLKRQHNLTSSSATTNVQATFLDRQSMTKFLNYNLNYNTSNNATEYFKSNLNAVDKGDNSSAVISTTTNFNNLFEDSNTFNTSNLKLLAAYPNIPKEMGDNSDKKDVRYPLQKLLFHSSPDRVGSKVNSSLLPDHLSISSGEDFTSQLPYLNELFEIKGRTDKFEELSGINGGIPFFAQSARLFKKLESHRTNLNLSQGFNSLDSTNNQRDNNLVSSSILDEARRSNAGWTDSSVFNKLASNRMSFGSTLPPIISSNPELNLLNFDRKQFKIASIQHNAIDANKQVTVSKIVPATSGQQVTLLSGAADSAPTNLTANYWNMYWSNTSPDFRIEAALNSSLNPEFFYLPPFTNCNEYDFRNAQALEMLEDAFWENSYTTSNHLDYLKSFDNATLTVDPTANKFLASQLFYKANLSLDLTQKALVTPAFRDLSTVGNFYSNNVQMDDYISPANLMNTKDFAIFPMISNLTSSDNSYVSSKGLSQLYAKNSTLLLNLNTSFNYPQSYLSVLNNFRGDFEDFSWYVDMSSKAAPALLNSNSIQQLNVDLTSTLESQNTGARYSNPVTLRSTAKNSIVTFSALQKVFRARFEDGRSNVRLNHFADLSVKQPLIMGKRLAFEKLLGKNKERFYNTSFYTNNTFSVLNSLSSSSNSLNTYFFDFPFLLSTLSDSAHFVWFDWYTQWNMKEVQPASVAKQSLAGVQYWRKGYEYSSNDSAFSAEAENYFTRISRARKNYLPLWVYTPYLYTRSNVWSPNSDLDQLNLNQPLSTADWGRIFEDMTFFEKKIAFAHNTSNVFTPTFSNSHKSTWRPYQSIQAYHYNLATLTDILTRREYLLRQYLETNNKIINLPKRFSASPTNPLLREIKSSFLLLDPITYNTESFRETFYHSVTGFYYFLAHSQVINWSEKVGTRFSINPTIIQKALGLRTNGTDPLHNALLYYFLDDSSKSGRVLGKSDDLYKSQYRPMRKGITNMLRLHGTGAVALPIELRLQILASSRDVIHSWAIPSAGIKIDCIPGYTSHRIMIFFTPGIYWGQCMEICGRYHHWMPIILYFMKRDLFFLWCTHFMSRSDFDTSWGINDRQFTDYVRFVSYDRMTWLTEISKQL